MTSHISLAKLIVAGAAMLFAGQALAETPVASADFKCADGKSIAATFYASSVALKLSDGRSLTVPQAMSASGARYANKDETFVFWNKGDTAFITEGDPDNPTFNDCIDETKKT
jgi:membrane-bound inhibitor of C-type lysozyme